MFKIRLCFGSQSVIDHYLFYLLIDSLVFILKAVSNGIILFFFPKLAILNYHFIVLDATICFDTVIRLGKMRQLANTR